MKCFSLTRFSSINHLKTTGNEKKENFAIDILAPESEHYESKGL